MVQGECFKGIADFLKINLNTVTPTAEWEAFNATLHDTFMSIIRIVHKNTQICMEEHESAMPQVEADCTTNPTTDTHAA